MKRVTGIGLLLALALAVLLPAGPAAADRFTPIVEQASGPTVTRGGFLVNQKRVAVQAELLRRPPTRAELGVTLPDKAVLNLEQTARQIAQYHPAWRVYDYRLSMPRAELILFFQAQGLVVDVHKNVLLFSSTAPGAAPEDADFIDGLFGNTVSGFRVWRRP